MTTYTGPLTVAAQLGHIDRPQDTGEHTVIILSLAIDCSSPQRGVIRARMEMTPEEAEDAAMAILSMAKHAKQKTR